VQVVAESRHVWELRAGHELAAPGITLTRPSIINIHVRVAGVAETAFDDRGGRLPDERIGDVLVERVPRRPAERGHPRHPVVQCVRRGQHDDGRAEGEQQSTSPWRASSSALCHRTRTSVRGCGRAGCLGGSYSLERAGVMGSTPVTGGTAVRSSFTPPCAASRSLRSHRQKRQKRGKTRPSGCQPLISISSRRQLGGVKRDMTLRVGFLTPRSRRRSAHAIPAFSGGGTDRSRAPERRA
jgi:hypothetical protein